MPPPDPGGRVDPISAGRSDLPILPSPAAERPEVPLPIHTPIGVPRVVDPSHEVDPRGLIEITVLRRVNTVMWLCWLPSSWLSLRVGLVVLTVAMAVLMSWSGLAVENARRAKPATRYTQATHPSMGAVSWLVPPLYAMWAVGMVVAIGVWADGAPADSDRRLVPAFLAIALFLVGLGLAYMPFAVLIRMARWVGADSARVRPWFALTALSSVFLLLVLVFDGLAASVDSSTGIDAADRSRLALLLVSSTLPWVSWLVLGDRAMREIEAATRITYHYRATVDVEPWRGAGRY